MVLCRFYQQGYCRYGDNCRFEHASGIKQNRNDYHKDNYKFQQQNQRFEQQNRFVALDDYSRGTEYSPSRKTAHSANIAPEGQMTFDEFVATTIKEIGDTSESQKQWPLSCFGPLKEGENYPGLEDVSPEECRWECLQSQYQGSFNSFSQKMEQMCKSQENILNDIRYRSPSAINYLRNIYKGQKIDSRPLLQNPSFTAPSFAQSTGFGFNLTKFSNPSSEEANAMNNSFKPPETKLFGSPFFSPNVFGVPNQPMMTSTQPVFAVPQEAPQQQQQHSFPVAPSFSSTVNSGFQNITSTQSSFTAVETKKETPPAFSNPNSFTQSTFASNSSGPNAHLYSPLEALTSEEREQFAAQSFILGKIPTKPPPIEFC